MSTPRVLQRILFLIKREKTYFLAPIIVALVLLLLFLIQAGPAVVSAFIYSGSGR